MPANLLEWVGSKVQTPIASVLIAGAQLPTQNTVSVDVDFGVDAQSSIATIRVAADAYPVWRPKDTVSIKLGYAGVGGGLQLVFLGEIEDLDTKYLPFFIEIKAAGFSKRLQRQAGNTDELSNPDQVPIITWNGATDSAIWNDIMKLAAVPAYSGGTGDSRTITGPIELTPADNLRGTIDQLDSASESAQKTFEFAGVVYRQAMLRVPGGVPNWQYVEGPAVYPQLSLYSVSRQSSDRDVKNQAIVSGRQDSGVDTADVPHAIRQAPSAVYGTDGFGNIIYVPSRLQNSPFLETRDQCDAVAQRYMLENNKITDVVAMRTPLNPFAMPGRTVGLLSERMGLSSMTNYYVRHVHHHSGADGATTDWQLEGGAGDGGYLVGLPPKALFTMTVTKETFQTGVYDTPTTFYTVACDGSTSSDPDGVIAAYAWTNNKNSDTGSAVLYSTKFTEAQWTDDVTPPSITLIVTDSDTPTPHTDSTGPMDVPSAAIDVKTIAMYVAAYGVAEATGDGWETAGTWSPVGAHVISVGRIGAQGTNYFGLDNGHIYKTVDYLATAPTDVGWTAPGGSAVNSIWMSELDSNTIGIGLANGDFWLTSDAFATAPMLQYNFTNPVTWIEGSFQNIQQWRVCVGQDVWYTNHNFRLGDVRVLVDFTGLIAEQTELTQFANYGAANGAAGNPVVKREADGFPIAFPALSPAPATARLTAFILTDQLLAGDDQGRSFISDPASAATTFVQKASIGYGAVADMLRDNTNFMAAYAACPTALAKTFDQAASWVRVRTYDGTTTRALRLGYDSAPLTPIAPVVLTDELVERTFQPNTHDYPDTDDPVANKIGMDLWNPLLSPDGEGARNDPPPTGWYTLAYTPADYTPAGTTHLWQPGNKINNVPYGGQFQYLDRGPYAWITSQTTGSGVPSGWSGTPGVGSHPRALFRHKFVLPPMTLGKVRLQVHTVIVDLLEFWINEHEITLPTGVQDVDTSWFTADGTTQNLVAVYAKDTGPNANPGFTYKLAFSESADTVSLLVDSNTGKVVWGSTMEGGVAFTLGGDPAGWHDPVTTIPLPAFGALFASDTGSFTGIYATPWPVFGTDNGKKWANANGSLTAGVGLFYHRQAVDIPAGADSDWKLYIRKQGSNNIIIYDVYLNGTRLSLPTPVSPAGDTGAALVDATHRIYAYTVPSGTVVMGARNTLAIKVGGSSGNTQYSRIAWYMEQQP